MPKRLFRFEFYSIHAHLESGVANYFTLLKALTSLRGHAEQNGSRHIVFGNASLDKDQLFLIVYTGSAEKITLLFDLIAQKELTESVSPDRFQAYKTYAMLDANKRLLIIESKRGNLSPTFLASLIESHAHTTAEFKALEISFNPVADPEFVVRLNEFQRIQSATITIARPNVDWTDQHNNLTEVAKASDARALDVTARSRRGKSLSKSGGLIDFIKSSAESAKSMFQKVRIVGSLSADSGLITLDLNKHVQHTIVTFDTDPATGLPSDNDVRSKLSTILHEAKSEDGSS